MLYGYILIQSTCKHSHHHHHHHCHNNNNNNSSSNDDDDNNNNDTTVAAAHTLKSQALTQRYQRTAIVMLH